MELDRDVLQKKIHALYAREHAELGERGTLDHLERGREWKLASRLKRGRRIGFPACGRT